MPLFNGLIMNKSFTQSSVRIVRWNWTNHTKFNSLLTFPIPLVTLRDPREITTENGVASTPTDRIEDDATNKPLTVVASSYRTFLDDVLANMAKES
jgi:hypothetical protein